MQRRGACETSDLPPRVVDALRPRTGDVVLVNESELPYRVTVVHRIEPEMLVRVTAVVARDRGAR